MTNHKLAIPNTKRPYNKKDGSPRPRSQASQYEAQGFVQIDWNSWNYTWKGNFPVFQIGPGILEGKAGMIAEFSLEIKIHFPYGTAPATIKAQLDDEILAIMRHDAEDDEPVMRDENDDWIDF